MKEEKSKNKIIFIKWFTNDRRNEAISSALGADCYFIYSLQKRAKWNAPFRYLIQFYKTLAVLYKEKPKIIFITNPPIFATLPVAIYSYAYKARYIIDSHTGAFSKKWKFVEFMHRFLSRRALLNIVTNSALEQVYKKLHAPAFILSDLVLDLPKKYSIQLDDNFNLAVICSFDPDEPIEEIMEAAHELPHVNFHITGNYKRLRKDLVERKSKNIVFTGFLPDQEYIDLLHACDGIMILVNTENTMQMGACEAISIRKPMILSNTEILRQTYQEGAVFVENNKESIKDGIKKIMGNLKSYQDKMSILYEERRKVWDRKCEMLMDIITKGTER